MLSILLDFIFFYNIHYYNEILRNPQILKNPHNGETDESWD
jgi:hypothetical protein